LDAESLSFSATLCSVALLLAMERVGAFRRQPTPIRYRWLTNLGLMFLGGLAVTILFSHSAVEVAAQVDGGLLRRWPLPPFLEIVLGFLLLDFWRYWEHRVYHEIPLLWRVHLVHHSDTGLDITTAERHHPFEAVLAVCTTLLLVFAFGISSQTLALYVGVATLSALVTHANIVLPEGLDRRLRGWLVTPSVHAFHHSDFQPQTDSNYGTVLSVWDRLFGSYTDPATGPVRRFGLQYFHRPEDRALGPVLLQPFEYRREMHYPERDEADESLASAPVVLGGSWRRALVSMAAGLFLALVALWPTVTGLMGVWSNSEPYQYAWLVLPMFGYLAGWHYRDRILSQVPIPDLLGVGVIFAAALLWCVAYAVDIQVGQHLALVLVVQGVVLSAVGRDVFRRFLPLMAMLFFLVPCGDLLQPVLRNLTVKWIEWLALLMQAPVRIDGFMAYVGDHRYVVVDACSGLTFVTLGAFLGYSFGLLVFRSFGRILALVAMGGIIGVLTNALRVWMIVGIDWLRGSQMDMGAHMDLQWLALLAALVLLFYCTARLVDGTGDEPPWTGAPMPAVGRGVARLAPVLAGLLVMVILLPVQGPFARAGLIPGGDPLQKVADAYGQSRWLATSGGDRALLIAPGDGLEIVLSEPLGEKGRPDLERLRPQGVERWRHAGTGRTTVCRDQACFELAQDTWRRKGSDEARHTLYAYYVGDELTASKLQYRLARGWQRFTGSDRPVGVVGFRVRGEPPPAAVLAAHLSRIRSLLNSD